MKQSKTFGLILLILLLSISALACNFSLELPWAENVPDVDISAEEVSAAATKAAEVASTAAAVASTAVTQGGDILGTAQIVPTIEAAATALAATSEASQKPPNSSGDNLLSQKLAAIQPDANGNFSILVTDAEFNQLIAVRQAAATQAGQPWPIENTRVTFAPDQVRLTGDVTDPVTAELDAKFRPIIENGKLRLQIIDATVGGFPVFQSMLSTIEAAVNLAVNEAMGNIPPNYILQDVILGDGAMTIVGQKQ